MKFYIDNNYTSKLTYYFMNIRLLWNSSTRSVFSGCRRVVGFVVKVIWQSVTLALTLLLMPKCGFILVQVSFNILVVLFMPVAYWISLTHQFFVRSSVYILKDSIPLKWDNCTYFLLFFSCHHITFVNVFSVLYISSVFIMKISSAGLAYFLRFWRLID